MGMLAYFVHLHLDSNLMTPTPILLMFIVSTLALAWSIFTLFSYHRSSANARFVAVIDLAFAGAFIAAVYFLRFIATADCGSIEVGSSVDLSLGALGNQFRLSVPLGWDVSVSKACGMLKGCFALGIMNVIFFFSTGFLAWIHGGHVEKSERRHREEERRSRHGSRHGSRHSRHGSHHRSGSGQRSRRSSHSHSRAYV